MHKTEPAPITKEKTLLLIERVIVEYASGKASLEDAAEAALVAALLYAREMENAD